MLLQDVTPGETSDVTSLQVRAAPGICVGRGDVTLTGKFQPKNFGLVARVDARVTSAIYVAKLFLGVRLRRSSIFCLSSLIKILLIPILA